jgi:Polyketide cyclase / dehydrase and lipid transport
MGKLSLTAEFRAPLERVWELFVDPERWRQWNTEWTDVRDVRGPFDHPGSGYTQVMRVLGREYRGRWEVTACEPMVERHITGTLPFGVPFRGRDRFEHRDGTTRVTVDLEWATPWGWLGRVLEFSMMPIMRRQFVSNARRAASLVE